MSLRHPCSPWFWVCPGWGHITPASIGLWGRSSSLLHTARTVPQELHTATPLLTIQPDPEVSKLVPAVYHKYLDVFNKRNADTLPPHWAYDCPIELLPRAEKPFGRIYPLSELELETLCHYIDESLEKGFIWPSTSPAGAGNFFVQKKDHTLRSCVDYQDLNRITVKNRYPLPLIPELFQRLRGAQCTSIL